MTVIGGMMKEASQIIGCPNCEQVFWNEKPHNRNITKDLIWSDGYRERGEKTKIPLITRCAHCDCYFWISSARIINGNNVFINKQGFKEIKSIIDENISEIRKLTAEEFAYVLAFKQYQNSEEERYLRMQLWWTINMPIRQGKSNDIDPEHGIFFEENLEMLVNKTPTDGPENLLLLAEIHRELGLFDESGKYLSFIADISFEDTVSKFRQKLASKEKRVFLL